MEIGGEAAALSVVGGAKNGAGRERGSDESSCVLARESLYYIGCAAGFTGVRGGTKVEKRYTNEVFVF